MLEAHTPPYYRDFLERYGMEKDHDLFAWRVFRAQFDLEPYKIPARVRFVADFPRTSTGKPQKFKLRTLALQEAQDDESP
jgi:acyl-coenzyme A synthetase/AMP-(fatty) acid ligase